MEPTCEHCNKTFASKYNLTKHLKTSKTCIKLRQNNTIVVTVHKCNYCAREFTRSDCLTLHFKVCLEKEKQEKEKILEELNETKKKTLEYEVKIASMEEKIASMEEKMKEIEGLP